MPPRVKQSGRRQAPKKSPSRSRTASEDEENRPQKLVAPSKRFERNKSREASKLDESMKSMKSVSQEETTPVALQAQQELEIQQSFKTITEEILNSTQDATAVTVVMKRTLLLHMRKAPALFQKTLLAFIQRLITLEGDESHVRNIHLLLTRLFHDLVQSNDRQNGVKLIKSVVRYLLDQYHLPKLLLKLQIRCGHMLALTINATAQKPQQGEADESVSQQAHCKQSRTFQILDESRHDAELRQKLEETVLLMLSVTKGTVASQFQGIQIGSFLSNYRDDRIFNQMMKLLIHAKSAAIRKKIIKSFRVPYSAPALAFLGKRLRDSDPTVVELVFEQLAENGVTISHFPTPQARMLVLTEGFTSVKDSVKEKCIEFLKPTVLEYVEKNNIAGLLKLIEAKLAFGNEYFGRMPGLLTLAIFEILQQDVILAQYLEKVVLKKLRRLAGISETKKRIQARKKADEVKDMYEFLLFEGKKEPAQDEEMVSNRGSELSKEVYDGDQATGPVTFEEILLLRLAFELNRSTKHQRSQAYLEKLEEIVPEFEDYRLITFALANMDEPNLPMLDPKEETIKPYPKGQIGFTRRAILGEWMKFSLQMNIQDEIIRKNLTTLCFELIGKIEYSYSDYEHLLKKQTQLLKGDDSAGGISLIVQACMNDEEDIQNDLPDIQELIQKQSNIRHSATDFQQAEENQSVEIIIRNFERIGTARSLQEYCKPFAMETLTLDFDDVCQVAVTVAKTLLGDRVDEFQLKIMEAISDIKETIQEESGADAFAGQRQISNMIFSQIPMQQQHHESGMTISFAKLRAKFMRKIEQKVDTCQALGADDADFDIQTFNKTFSQLQIFVHLVEETHLKEKLSYKRALILCRSLLKQCRLANVHDHNVISICESFIHPAVLNVDDKENILLALECIGLICILDKEVFLNYSKSFIGILQAEIRPDGDDRREKVIAIKSVVDSLIIHGIGEEQLQEFFDILTTNYLTTKDRVIRQVTIEGVCKMLFTKNLCDQNAVERVEAILAQLLFQSFDRKYNKQNSLVKSILKHFLSNFALFSEQRCHMLLNALTKVTYAVLRERYGLDKSAVIAKAGAKKGKTGKVEQKKRKKVVSSSDSEAEVSYDVDYDSDDSKFAEEKVQMRQVCISVDLVQMCRVVMILLSRKYVNDNTGEGGLKLKTEFSILFFQRLLRMNRDLFKKTQIVKDVITSVLEVVCLESCDYLDQLKQVEKQWEQTSKLLLQIPKKVANFQHRLNNRVLEFEEIVEVNHQCSSKVNRQKDGDFEMNHSGVKVEKQEDSAAVDSEDDDGRDPFFNIGQLEEYWQDYIEAKVVDRGTDDDRELLQLQQVWIELTAKEKNLLTSSQKKSILKSPSNFGILGGNHVEQSVSHQKVKQPLARPKRGGRQTQKPTQQAAGSAIAIGRAIRLQSISEETDGPRSASRPNLRKVRIVEQHKESRPKRTKGPVKSEISEDDEDESDSFDISRSQDRHQSQGSDSSSEDLFQSSHSQSMHKNTFNDNLGLIANNIARKFAKKYKRSPSPSNKSKSSDPSQNLSERWQQSKGMNTLKLEQPEVLKMKNELHSADKHSQKSSDLDKHSQVRKGLIRDFDVASNEKPLQKKVGMLTRRKLKSQSSNLSNSRSSAADDNFDESDDMYDFMDGTLTKQLKQKQKVGIKEPPRRQEIKQEASLDISNSSGRPKSSKLTRQKRTKQ